LHAYNKNVRILAQHFHVVSMLSVEQKITEQHAPAELALKGIHTQFALSPDVRETMSVQTTKHAYKESVKILACLKPVELMLFVRQRDTEPSAFVLRTTRATHIDSAIHMNV
jgi:hypothetical protein